jgi:hypothetical protein
MISVLDRKLWRDLLRMWTQVLAISLVMACGVATILIAVGSYRSLEETRQAFYDRYRFATVFAGLTRAPLHLREAITRIEGVSGVELRIVRPALLDIAGMAEPATAGQKGRMDAGQSTGFSAGRRAQEERESVSVANHTRRDQEEFFPVARQAGVRTHTTTYPLAEANQALHHLRTGRLRGRPCCCLSLRLRHRCPGDAGVHWQLSALPVLTAELKPRSGSRPRWSLLCASFLLTFLGQPTVGRAVESFCRIIANNTVVLEIAR